MFARKISGNHISFQVLEASYSLEKCSKCLQEKVQEIFVSFQVLETSSTLEKVVQDVRSCDQGNEIIIGIDNTFLTPWVG